MTVKSPLLEEGFFFRGIKGENLSTSCLWTVSSV